MLTDFGLVKLFGDDAKEGTHLTSSGTGLGTPDYMAPEQWTGETTAQSDLYSLGVVLYEMITGHRPYTADTPAGVLLKQATEPLPLPTRYITDLPLNVESVLLKALAKEPKNRYSDMHTFIAELQNLLSGKEVVASQTKVEKLREQMTGKMKIPAAAYPSQQPARSMPIIPILIGVGVLGVIVVLGVVLLFAKSNLFAVAPTPTEQLLPSPSPAPTETQVILPTETVLPTVAATATILPTETPFLTEIKDSKNVSMVYIRPGEFTMGSDDTGDIGSRPAHKVNVEAFYIDKYEVTNEMYDACVYAVECRKPLQQGSATRNTYFSNPSFAKYPVIFIDWKMANAYCAWRGARLPTEAEWEKAGRGTDQRIYPWGTNELNCSFANFAGCIDDTAPVTQYEKGVSIYGVYGMSGNVWEWTSSLYKLYPYDAYDGREDPKASGERIARGGSWKASFGGNAGNVRLDTRLKLSPAYTGPYVGFRCARSMNQ
jgi:formylglycine-generating enzyme required for sulfatase activity